MERSPAEPEERAASWANGRKHVIRPPPNAAAKQLPISTFPSTVAKGRRKTRAQVRMRKRAVKITEVTVG
jgi:hypothetical protein